MNVVELPDFEQSLSADALNLSLFAGKDACRGRKYQKAVTALNRLNIAYAKVHAAAGLRDALESAKGRTVVFVDQTDGKVDVFGLLVYLANVALASEDVGNSELDLRARQCNARFAHHRGVLEAHKHV